MLGLNLIVVQMKNGKVGFNRHITSHLEERGNSSLFPLGLVWAKRHDVSGRRP